MNFNNNKAFTLIELLVVVAIIGILAAVGVVAYNGYTASAKSSATKANLNMVVKKLKNEMALCEVKDPSDLAYVGGAGNYRGIECKQMIAGGPSWSQLGNAVTTYHEDVKNVYNKNRPGISAGCSEYELSVITQESFVGTIWYCQWHSPPPHKVEIYTCHKSPCSDTSNHLRFTINRGD